MALLPGRGFLDRRFSVSLDLSVLLGSVDGYRKQTRRRNLLGTEVGLDAGQDSLADVRMLAQERGRVLPALAEALESLERESERARRLVERRGPGAGTARYLAARGFGEEALEAALGADFAPDP